MIDAKHFVEALGKANIDFVTGVPDSLLKQVCACFSDTFNAQQHVIATNEGSAIGLAIGHYLASQKPALVYLQNSGLGNVINPITSLADPEIYAIPMVLMIGWRGEITPQNQQIADEPQHRKQGRITESQLNLLNIPYKIIDGRPEDVDQLMQSMVKQALKRQGPVALLVRKKSFKPYQAISSQESTSAPKREAIIQGLIDVLPAEVPVVSTTGMASRELFEYRREKGHGHAHDFLTVGGMGHASQIATAIAMQKPKQKVLCLDGDGAVLMHMGGLALSAKQQNLIHVVINNGAHDSVGGQATVAKSIQLTHIAYACGYGSVVQIKPGQSVESALQKSLQANKSVFIEVLCEKGSRKDLGRPDRTPVENKQAFMNFLSQPVKTVREEAIVV